MNRSIYRNIEGRNMHEKKYEDAKKEIRSVLLTYQDRVILNEFVRTYRNLLGQRLPSRDLGFSSDVEFLMSMPDVVDVKSDSEGKVYLSGIADKASSHIQKLVSRQRKSKSSNSKCNKRDARQPIHKLPTTPPKAKELKPFLPGSLRVEILELMSSKDSLPLSSFVLAYHQKFNKYLPLISGLNSLEAMIKLVPELEIGKNEYNETVIYNKRFLKASESVNREDESSFGMITGNNTIQEKGSFDIHESGISDEILNEFQMVLQKYSNGIMNIHFPPLYEKVTGKSFDVVELGYNSMADLVEVLPHIFQRVSNPDDEQCWLIYPAGSHVEKNFEANHPTDSSSKKHLYHPKEDILACVSPPGLQYIQSTMPDHINLHEYFPVFVSAISSPSLFWFQLQTDEFIENLEKLENDIKNFYSNAYDKYKMNSADIAIGATCVIKCPDDNQYYRAVIKAIPSTELVNVSYVDYGSMSNVPRNHVHYVWNKLHKYPAFAFQAELSGLRPSKNAITWSSKARKRFVELCNCLPVMTLIKSLDKDNYSVILCDTNGKEDIYFHHALINEGHAESTYQSIFDIDNSTSINLETVLNGHNNLVDSDSGSINNQDLLLSDDSEMSASELNEFLVNKLSLSASVQNEVVQSNDADFLKDKHFKRYIKEIEICEGSKIHLINLEKKLFMSCCELCSLLWSEKDTSFLIRKLEDKEIDIPFLCVKKEDYKELFKQYLWYKCEKKDSDNSCLILCPLEKAFDVLNIFGHPSICLRIIIQHEIKTFDPNNEFWNEVFYQESPDMNAIESGILEEINKLCLYDLKAKYEAFKIQKLKHLRYHSSGFTEEIRKIENILNIITRRIKQIEAICAQYSSCS